jgi:hypothetical protein
LGNHIATRSNTAMQLDRSNRMILVSRVASQLQRFHSAAKEDCRNPCFTGSKCDFDWRRQIADANLSCAFKNHIRCCGDFRNRPSAISSPRISKRQHEVEAPFGASEVVMPRRQSGFHNACGTHPRPERRERLQGFARGADRESRNCQIASRIQRP